MQTQDIKIISSADVPALYSNYGGGIVIDKFILRDQTRLLIRAPLAHGYLPELAWNKSMKRVDGAASFNDGLGNTVAMANAGSKLAETALDLTINGIGGWYLMSQYEALVAFWAQQHPDFPAAEKIPSEWLWTSTQCPSPADSDYAFVQGFGNGNSSWGHESNKFRGFAVRCLIIQ